VSRESEYVSNFNSHPVETRLINNERLIETVEKEKKDEMLEEMTVQATRTLLALFWLLLAFIIIAAVATAKTEPKAGK